LNRFKIWTRLEPTTTKRKKATSVLLTGLSSSCSAALPTGTFPRLVIFLSNLVDRFLMFRGKTIFLSFACWMDKLLLCDSAIGEAQKTGEINDAFGGASTRGYPILLAGGTDL